MLSNGNLTIISLSMHKSEQIHLDKKAGKMGQSFRFVGGDSSLSFLLRKLSIKKRPYVF